MKFKVVLILIFTLIIFYIGYKFNTINTKDAVNNELNTLQKQVEKYKDEQNKQKMRQLELQTLQNPQLTTNKLKEVGKLVTYEGRVRFEDTIKEDSFWGSKQLVVNLKYNFGLSFDLTKISVVNIYEKTITLQVPKNEIVIEYIELSNESKIESSKTWFSSKYTAEDTKLILDNAQNKIREYLQNNKTYFNSAISNLKKVINELVTKLGYEKVIIKEV